MKKIVEINGVKLEVDTREATKVESFKVGDHVKLLKKTYSSYEVYHGMLVDFNEFAKLPTLVVCYVEYSGIKFAYINAENKDMEICAAGEAELFLDAEDIMAKMMLEHQKKIEEAEELQRKMKYFSDKFGKYFKTDKELI